MPFLCMHGSYIYSMVMTLMFIFAGSSSVTSSSVDLIVGVSVPICLAAVVITGLILISLACYKQRAGHGKPSNLKLKLCGQQIF